MKRSAGELPPDAAADSLKTQPKKNGHRNVSEDVGPEELKVILRTLQTMSDGNFSARMPGSWTGISGKIADTFNDIAAANEHIANELKRVGQVVGKEGKTRERARFRAHRGAWGEMEVSVNTLVEDLLRPTAEVTGAIAAVARVVSRGRAPPSATHMPSLPVRVRRSTFSVPTWR